MIHKFFISLASYSDASYSSDDEDGGLNPREVQQVRKKRQKLNLFSIEYVKI